MLTEVIPPADIEAERHVAGACMLSMLALADAMAKMKPADFMSKPYSWMFTTASELALAGQPVNVNTVATRMGEVKTAEGKSRLEEAGGPMTVTEAIEGVEPADFNFYAERVKKKAIERAAVSAAEWLLREALNSPEDIGKLLTKAEERLAVVQGIVADDEIVDGSDGYADLEARINRYINDPDAITGFETKWELYDRMLDGHQPGNVYIYYAPSSRYKSFVVTNIGWRFARQGVPGLWYTTEMPKIQTQERVVQLESGLNFKWLRRDGTIGKHRDAIRKAIRDVSNYPIFYSKRDELDMNSLRGEVLRQVRLNRIQYVIIDLVDSVSSSQYGDNEVSNQSSVMRKMKSLAKRANVAIILVSHVAKGDKALNKKPSLDVEEMKGTSSKYQDVDAAVSIMPVRWDAGANEYIGLDRREISYQVKTNGFLTLMVAITKNRQGEIGDLVFTINLNHGGRMVPQASAVWEQVSMPEPEPPPYNWDDDEEEVDEEPTICTSDDIAA